MSAVTRGVLRAGEDASLPLPSILIVVIEFWERFSYYGMTAILVLFVSAPTSRGGFGWTLSAALILMSVFTGIAWSSPVLGGILADRYLGSRRAVAWGAAFLTLGNLVLVAATGPRSATLFYAALGLIVLGNALLKSTLPVLLGQVFAAHGGRNDAAYSYYYMAVTLGALVSSLAVGYLAQHSGWASGFGCAAAGMVVALLLYFGLGSRLLGEVGLVPAGRPARPAERVPARWSDYRPGLVRIAVYGLFLVVFAIGWIQSQGLWLYVIEKDVQRNLAGFVIPAPWFLALYSVLVIVYSPLYAGLSQRLERARGSELAFGTRFVAGFAILAVTHGLMALGFSQPAGAPAPMGWPIAAMVVLAAADVVVWPPSYGMVQRLSPPALRSALLGAWIGMLGLGQSLAHAAAAFGERWGFSTFSWRVAALMAGCAVVLAGVDRLLGALEGRCAESRSSTGGGTGG